MGASGPNENLRWTSSPGDFRRRGIYEEVDNQLCYRAIRGSLVSLRRAGHGNQDTTSRSVDTCRKSVACALTCTLTSKTSKAGDPFTGMVTTPIVVDGKEVISQGSTVEGHVAFVKQSGRVSGVAQMRVVLDDIITPDDMKLALPAGLDDMNAGPCAKTNGDEEGTIKGCGKNKKDALKDAGIAGGQWERAPAPWSAWVRRSIAGITAIAAGRAWALQSAWEQALGPARS